VPVHLAGAGIAPPASAGANSLVYRCDCEGFRRKKVTRFCLRCLSIWVDGLPGVFHGEKLERHMRLAAAVLARHLRDDPSLGRLTLNAALDASERFPRRG
jgi:hypothetical protein